MSTGKLSQGSQAPLGLLRTPAPPPWERTPRRWGGAPLGALGKTRLLTHPPPGTLAPSCPWALPVGPVTQEAAPDTVSSGRSGLCGWERRQQPDIQHSPPALPGATRRKDARPEAVLGSGVPLGRPLLGSVLACQACVRPCQGTDRAGSAFLHAWARGSAWCLGLRLHNGLLFRQVTGLKKGPQVEGTAKMEACQLRGLAG